MKKLLNSKHRLFHKLGSFRNKNITFHYTVTHQLSFMNAETYLYTELFLKCQLSYAKKKKI
jgi:hypothetical protein